MEDILIKPALSEQKLALSVAEWVEWDSTWALEIIYLFFWEL